MKQCTPCSDEQWLKFYDRKYEFSFDITLIHEIVIILDTAFFAMQINSNFVMEKGDNGT